MAYRSMVDLVRRLTPFRRSVAQLGINTETLRGWVTQAEVDVSRAPRHQHERGGEDHAVEAGQRRVAAGERDLAVGVGLLRRASIRTPPRSSRVRRATWLLDLRVEELATPDRPGTGAGPEPPLPPPYAGGATSRLSSRTKLRQPSRPRLRHIQPGSFAGWPL